MGRAFSHFVILAGMRTGSNLLEDNLARFPDLETHGELFNPSFIGNAGRHEHLGIGLAAREADPHRLMERMLETAGDRIPGFRFFHDHDPRILGRVLEDPACGKVVLARNPLESYVSRKIAQQTGQWRLTDMRGRARARVRFDAAEFEAEVDALQLFHIRITRSLQTTSQAAFHINYEDLRDIAVINGLGRWLGSEHRLEQLSDRLKKQNTESLEDVVENADEMAAALERFDTFALARTPALEPRRGAVVPRYIASRQFPILFQPVVGAPQHAVIDWMARHDGIDPATAGDSLLSGFTQKTLRQWRRRHPGRVTFTVLRHPAERAHLAFCRHILATGPGTFLEIRARLVRDYGLALPPPGPLPEDWTAGRHREAFLGFLRFLKANVAGQTGIRVDPSWASQTAILQGISELCPPDLVIRENRLAEGLAHVEQLLGMPARPPGPGVTTTPVPLQEIHDGEIEELLREIYARDYLNFGFPPWNRAEGRRDGGGAKSASGRHKPAGRGSAGAGR